MTRTDVPYHLSRELLLHGILIFILLIIGWIPFNAPGDIIKWIIILVTSGLVYLLLILKIGKIEWNKRTAIFVFIIAAVFRLAAIPLNPVLSDDVYRNIWDGRVETKGINPYKYTPLDASIYHLRDDDIWKKINHPDYRTIYPPAAQIFSWASVKTSQIFSIDELISWKIWIFIVEMFGGYILYLGLKNAGRASFIIVYLWCPLSIVELYVSGHVDGIGIGFLAMSIGAVLLHRKLLAGFCFITSVWTKLLSLPAIVGYLLLNDKSRLLIGGILGLLWIIPYIDSGRYSIESLNRYEGSWEFNGVLHRALKIDDISYAIREKLSDRNDINPKMVGRICVASLAIFAGLFVAFFSKSFEITALWTLGSFILLQPTIYPWYILWLLPFLALFPVKGFIVWISLIPLSYEVLYTQALTGEWKENHIIQWLIIAPVIIVIIFEYIKTKTNQ